MPRSVTVTLPAGTNPQLLTRASLLSAAPIAAVFVALFLLASFLLPGAPSGFFAAALLLMSFGGTFDQSARATTLGLSGTGGFSIFFMVLAFPIIIGIAQRLLHRRRPIGDTEALAYSAGAAGGAVVIALLLSFVAKTSASLSFLETSGSGGSSVSPFVPAVLMGAVAFATAWQGSIPSWIERTKVAVLDLGRYVKGVLVIIATLTVGVFVVYPTWMIFQSAIGKSEGFTLGAAIGGLLAWLIYLPNTLFSLVLGLSGASAGFSASGSILGLSELSRGASRSSALPWWAQLAVALVIVCAFALRRRDPSTTRWWENAAVFAVAGIVVAWATRLEITGQVTVVILSGAGRARAGFDYGSSALRLGLVGALIGVLSHPSVMRVTERTAEPVRGLLSRVVAATVAPARRRFTPFVRRLTPSALGRLPLRVRRPIVAVAALLLLWLVALIAGTGVSKVGAMVTPQPRDVVDEVAAALRSGNGQELERLFGLSSTPISSTGVDVSVSKGSSSRSSNGSSGRTISYELTISKGGDSESMNVDLYKDFDDGAFLGLVPKWRIGGQSNLEIPTVESSSPMIIDGATASTARVIRVMPGTHSIAGKGTGSYIEGVSRSVVILSDTSFFPTYRVTSSGISAATTAVNTALQRCPNSSYICPSYSGTIVALPSGYSVTSIDATTVRVRSSTSGRYAYESRALSGYSYSFSVDAVVTFSEGGVSSVR